MVMQDTCMLEAESYLMHPRERPWLRFLRAWTPPLSLFSLSLDVSWEGRSSEDSRLWRLRLQLWTPLAVPVLSGLPRTPLTSNPRLHRNGLPNFYSRAPLSAAPLSVAHPTAAPLSAAPPTVAPLSAAPLLLAPPTVAPLSVAPLTVAQLPTRPSPTATVAPLLAVGPGSAMTKLRTGVGVGISGTFVLVYTIFFATDSRCGVRGPHVMALAPLPMGCAVFMVLHGPNPDNGEGGEEIVSTHMSGDMYLSQGHSQVAYGSRVLTAFG